MHSYLKLDYADDSYRSFLELYEILYSANNEIIQSI